MSASTTTTPNTTTTTTTSTPPSPPASPARKQRPTLTLNPTTRPSYNIYDSPDSVKSCFSPCSSESGSESESESEAPVQGRPWASPNPPSLPPSGPPPAVPNRFPSFSSASSGTSGCRPVFSPGPNTPALPLYGMPSAPTAPSTPYSPWSTGSMPPKVDVALMGLESGLTAVLGGQPPEELVVARKERDVLVVRVQKAYYKREEVGVLQWELTKAEMRVKTLEQRWLLAVLSGVEAMVGNIRAGMAPHVQEQSEEDDECAVESEDEDEILEVFQHTVIEPEVQSPEIPAHLERRFIWIRSASSFDSDSDSDAGYDSDSEYEDDGYDSDRLSVPALLHSRSASSSEASSSPIIPGVNDWAPFSAPVDGSEEKKTAGALILRIAGVEMEMI